MKSGGSKSGQSAQTGPIIRAESIHKSFIVGDKPVEVLKDISLRIMAGEFVIIYGPSGSGKSTLLNCLIGLEPATKGYIWVKDKRLDQLEEDERAGIRTETFGVVYQQPIWVRSLSVLENVALPMMIRGMSKRTALSRARAHLRSVKMDQYSARKAVEISGGEQQRVGIARSMINDPHILVLDEPTGNLDTHTADQMLAMLKELNRTHNVTILMVTHNLAYLPVASRTIGMKDGRIESMRRNPKHHDHPLNAHKLHGGRA